MLQDAAGGVLVEVKATTVSSVRMTRTQADNAVKEAGRFALCVVPVASGKELVLEDVAREARFVIDIGARLALLTSEVRGLELVREAATLRYGEFEVLMTGADIRFRVGSGAWDEGLAIEQFVEHVASRR